MFNKYYLFTSFASESFQYPLHPSIAIEPSAITAILAVTTLTAITAATAITALRDVY